MHAIVVLPTDDRLGNPIRSCRPVGGESIPADVLPPVLRGRGQDHVPWPTATPEHGVYPAAYRYWLRGEATQAALLVDGQLLVVWDTVTCRLNAGWEPHCLAGRARGAIRHHGANALAVAPRELAEWRVGAAEHVVAAWIREGCMRDAPYEAAGDPVVLRMLNEGDEAMAAHAEQPERFDAMA
jgi:hypothetical protein